MLARAGAAPPANPTARAKPAITSTGVTSTRRRAAPNLTFELRGTVPTPLDRHASPRPGAHRKDHHIVTTAQRRGNGRQAATRVDHSEPGGPE